MTITTRNRFVHRAGFPPAIRTAYTAMASSPGDRTRRSCRVAVDRGDGRRRGEILTIPDTPTTQGLSLWCFNIVATRTGATPLRGTRSRQHIRHCGLSAAVDLSNTIELTVRCRAACALRSARRGVVLCSPRW